MTRRFAAWSWLRTIVRGLDRKRKRRAAAGPRLEPLETRVTPSLAYVPADYDADGRSDLALWTPRPDAGADTFFTRGGDGVTYPVPWGELYDVPITGDYDGDGRADHAIFRPFDERDGNNGEFYGRFHVKGSQAGNFTFAFGVGAYEEIPISGDYNGDGRTDFAMLHRGPGDGGYKYYVQLPGGTLDVPFGGVGDIPVAGDYDGDGRTDLAVFRPGTSGNLSRFFIRYSSEGYTSGTIRQFDFGLAGDYPLAADFDGNGRTDLAVYRPGAAAQATGTYFWRDLTQTNGQSLDFGKHGDVPVEADFNADGRTDFAVWRPENGLGLSEFIIRHTTADSPFFVTAGAPFDIPVNAPWNALPDLTRPWTGPTYLSGRVRINPDCAPCVGEMSLAQYLSVVFPDT